MKTFNNLKFKPHLTGDGLASKEFFPNGYGVSVVRFMMPDLTDISYSPLALGSALTHNEASISRGYGSYTDNENEWELAVLEGNKNNWELTHKTPITNDVVGHLSKDEVTEIMKRVQELASIL